MGLASFNRSRRLKEIEKNKQTEKNVEQFEEVEEEQDNEENQKITKVVIMQMLKEKGIQFDRADKKEVLLKLLEGDSNE